MKTPKIPFVEFPKISRFSREVIVSEKIDGTNAQIYIPQDYTQYQIDQGETEIYAGSRTRWITPEEDNHGFARWVEANKRELLRLGAGNHYGEWWGQGIQRGYGLKEKRFSLFNVGRWGPGGKDEALRPACCHVIPVLFRGLTDDLDGVVTHCLKTLRETGSVAAQGFMRPEGIVIYHVAGNVAFKKTLERDDQPKGAQR